MERLNIITEDGEQRAMTAQEHADFVASLPPPPEPPAPPVLTKLAKAELWRRCSDTEAEALSFALSQAPLRLRMIFDAAQYLDTADADYTGLRAGVIAAVGEARADELLTPEF